MNLVLVGLNHKTAPIEIRERFSMTEGAMGEALCRLKADPQVEEVAIVSTCNRVEVCAVVRETRAGLEALSSFLTQYASGLPPEKIAPCLYLYSATDCIRHLFRVAGSLDSMVIGEPQILGQVKDAFDQAMLHKTTGVILNKIFKKTLSVAKRIRTETKIAENAVSISYAAVELARKIFGKLSAQSVLLIGAGEMAELAARHFVDHRIKSIAIANRSFERAVELAHRFNGVPVAFEDFMAEMVASDIVLCSAGAPHYLIGVNDVARVVTARQNRPIFLIDISVPRNIDPAVNGLDNVFLYDIDDLKFSVEANLRMREMEALKAEEIVVEEAGSLSRWLKSLDAVPMIVALKDRAEEIRRSETEKLFGKIGALTPAQREALEGMTSAIVNKLLHDPLTVLREEAGSANGNMVLEAARKLFHLEEADVENENLSKSRG
jgi:glutamyl-tRNA reductase